jgi:hypothetical protein
MVSRWPRAPVVQKVLSVRSTNRVITIASSTALALAALGATPLCAVPELLHGMPCFVMKLLIAMMKRVRRE